MNLHTSIPSPDPAWAVFQLGPLVVHIYALFILTGIVVATAATQYRLARRGARSWIVVDVVLWAVPFGIVGARLYHVFTHISDYFYPGADLWKVFAIWDGGNAIFGSLLGGAVGAYIGCRREGIRFWSFADALAPAMLAAQAIGRLGNYFNHELFGLPTALPWGLEIEVTNSRFPAGLPEGTLFHPLFMYEIVWNILGIILILTLERRANLRWGRAFGVYLIWYGLGRSFLEAIRIDPTSDAPLGIAANIWGALFAVIIGVVILIVQGHRHTGIELSVALRPESAEASVRDKAVPAR